jgi:SWI/SNF-related matrix-associated actin-dependent regulator of chromatin subfamily A3
MNAHPDSHMTLKRPYPFEPENAHIPHYGQQQYARSIAPTDEPLCLLGSVRPTYLDQIIVLISLQVIDVKAQARGEACDFIHRTHPLETTRHDVAFDISPKGDYFELCKNECAFARLDKAFCSEARRLTGLGVEFQACLERKRWEEVTRAWGPYADETVTFSVDVNVKSLMHHADKVGNILLRSGIFLQSPSQNPGGETYYNPQILQIEGFCERPDEVMTEAEDAPTPAAISDRPAQNNPKPSLNPQDHVEQILDSLSHTNILHEIRTDTNRIKSTLMGQVFPSSRWTNVY